MKKMYKSNRAEVNSLTGENPVHPELAHKASSATQSANPEDGRGKK